MAEKSAANDTHPTQTSGGREKMTRLTSELLETFTKSHELEKKISEGMGVIKYDI